MRLPGVCVGPRKSLLESQVSTNKPESAASAHRAPLQNRPRQTAGRKRSMQLQRGLLEMGVGEGGQREPCDSWGPRTPKSRKGMGDSGICSLRQCPLRGSVRGGRFAK